MVRKQWGTACRKHIVCVDSYENRILRGRVNISGQEEASFSSLTEMLLMLESRQDDGQALAADLYSNPPKEDFSPIRKGAKATFELQILFRQHSSWQGLLKWREKNIEQSFKSVLELIMLMDSALAGEA